MRYLLVMLPLALAALAPATQAATPENDVLMAAPGAEGSCQFIIHAAAAADGEAPDTVMFPGMPLPPPMGQKVKMTYLGVATMPAGETLTEQLKLPKGAGLVVDFVEPDSPAAAAGIRKHDILLKLDDQILLNTEQLASLVRMHKPKDKVAVTLVREGKEQKIAAELAETERLMSPRISPNMERFALPSMDQMQPMLDALRNRVGGGMVRPPQPMPSSTSFADEEHGLTVTTDNNGRRLLAKDKDGKVIFDGPINTAEEREKVPEPVRKKLDLVERSAHMTPGAGAGIGGARIIITPGMAKPEPGKPETKRSQTKSEARADFSATASVSDNDMTLTLTTNRGNQHLVATDKSGNVLFDGPVNTEEERSKVPEPVRKRLGNLNVSGQISIEPPVETPAKPEAH